MSKMSVKTNFILLVISAVVISNGDIPCNKRTTEYGYICVCNSTYCDTISAPENLPEGQFRFYYTSSESPGFNQKTGYFRMQAFSPKIKIKVNTDQTFQSIRGFGGTFTDAFGATLKTLSENAQELLLGSLFSKYGAEYTVCRVVIASADFSLRQYTYLDKYDPSLKSFNLTDDDFKYKIDVIKRVLRITKRPIQLLGATWTCPNWMKTNNVSHYGYIRKEYRQSWADYHVKALDAWKAAGVEFWGLTTGNEAIIMYQIHAEIPNLIMFPEATRDWVVENLGPALEKANYSTKLIILDDQRMYALWYMDTVMRHSSAWKYIHGIGLHWYFDNTASPTVMDVLHNKYPEKEIMYTESSINPATKSNIALSAFLQSDKLVDGAIREFDPSPPNIGSWRRGVLYLRNIIENLNHRVTSYIDWNLALDTSGGPNVANFSCDAGIIINATADEFYKSPMYYVMAHFSKFMPPGSKIIDLQTIAYEDFQSDLRSSPPPHNVTHPWPFPTTPPDYNVEFVGSLNQDGSKTIIFYNPLESPVEVGVYDPQRGYGFLVLEPQSIGSMIYY